MCIAPLGICWGFCEELRQQLASLIGGKDELPVTGFALVPDGDKLVLESMGEPV